MGREQEKIPLTKWLEVGLLNVERVAFLDIIISFNLPYFFIPNPCKKCVKEAAG
jgi:hypothetical protein